MNRWLVVSLSVPLLGLVSCGSDSDSVCGSGELIETDDQSVCLFKSELIEEGFNCPSEFSFLTELEGGGAACGEGENLSELVEAELASRGYVEVVTSNNTNNLNNVNNINNVVDIVGSPITFTMIYTTDVPETVYAQEFDANGFPGWVTLRRDGVVVAPKIECARGICGTNDRGGVCAPPSTTPFAENEFGNDISFTWEGTTWENDPSGCATEVAIDPSGLWEAEFCFGFQSQPISGGDGSEVTNVQCATETFDPAVDTMVEHRFDFGG